MLYVWMPEETAQPSAENMPVHAQWRWCTDAAPLTTWQSAHDWSSLIQATQYLGKTAVTLFFPTSVAQLIRQPIHAKQYKQLGEKGLAYAVEEYSLLPVEQLTLRHSFDAVRHLNVQSQAVIESSDQALLEVDTQTGHRVTVLAMPTQHIHGYTHMCSLVGWTLEALVPDFLLLPVTTTQLTLNQDHLQYLVRQDQTMGYRVDALDTILPFLPQNEVVNVIGQVDAVSLQQCVDAGYTLNASPEQLIHPSMIQATQHVFNLISAKQQASIPKYWKVIVAVLICACLVQVFTDSMRMWRESKITQALVLQSSQLFSQWFAGERVPKDAAAMKSAVKKHLKSTDDTANEALVLLSKVGPVLAQNNATAQQINFVNHSLQLTVQLTNMQMLDQLKSQLTAQGLVVEGGNASGTGNHTTAELSVRLN